jgi:SAM-dependent methyltransferase
VLTTDRNATVYQSEFWDAVAAGYRRIGPPLMPTDEDATRFEDAIRTHGTRAARPRALLLGVTPLLANLRWSDPTMLLAVDASMPFLRAVWPGDVRGRRGAVRGDWRRLPVRDASYDIAVGDGSFNCLPYPAGIRDAAAAVKRALDPDGVLVMRLFVRPDPCESPEALVEELNAHRVGTFHQFKFRLLMALQRTVHDGIVVSDVYRYWHALGRRSESRPPTSGWSAADVETIENYRGSSTVHVFPTLTEWRAVLCEAFEEIAIQPASYVLGDRCPVIALRARR